MAVQFLFCGVFFPRFHENSVQHSCVGPIQLFPFKHFIRYYVVRSSNKTDTIAFWKNPLFNLVERSDFHRVDNLSIASHAFLCVRWHHFLNMKYCYLGLWNGQLISETYLLVWRWIHLLVLLQNMIVSHKKFNSHESTYGQPLGFSYFLLVDELKFDPPPIDHCDSFIACFLIVRNVTYLSLLDTLFIQRK